MVLARRASYLTPPPHHQNLKPPLNSSTPPEHSHLFSHLRQALPSCNPRPASPHPSSREKSGSHCARAVTDLAPASYPRETIDDSMKYVLVTGGVVSGLGKGVTASSIGVVLKACGLRVTSIKIGKPGRRLCCASASLACAQNKTGKEENNGGHVTAHSARITVPKPPQSFLLVSMRTCAVFRLADA
jgi:hypothetical protein